MTGDFDVAYSNNPTAEFPVTFFDPCTTTTFVPIQVDTIYYFVDQTDTGFILKVDVPYQTDRIKEMWGTTGVESVCGPRTLVISDINGISS